MTSSVLDLPKLALIACGLVAVGGIAWETGRAPLKVEIAQLKLDHTAESLRIADHATEVLKLAGRQGDALSNALAQSQEQIETLSREKRDAVSKVTTGRTCLGESALRLLSTAPGIRVHGLGPAASGPAAAGSTSAANPDHDTTVSTDADITSWAIDAGAQHEVCRARLDALIDWHTKPTPATIQAEHHD